MDVFFEPTVGRIGCSFMWTTLERENWELTGITVSYPRGREEEQAQDEIPHFRRLYSHLGVRISRHFLRPPCSSSSYSGGVHLIASIYWANLSVTEWMNALKLRAISACISKLKHLLLYTIKNYFAYISGTEWLVYYSYRRGWHREYETDSKDIEISDELTNKEIVRIQISYQHVILRL